GYTDLSKPRVKMPSIQEENQQETYYNRSSSSQEDEGPHTTFHCPGCNQPLYKNKKDVADSKFFVQKSGKKWVNTIRKSVNYVCTNKIEEKVAPSTNQNPSKDGMKECGYVLWQPQVLPSDSKRRKVSPA